MEQLTTPHQMLAAGGLGVAPETKKKGTSLSRTWVETSQPGGAAVIPPLTMVRSSTPGLELQYASWRDREGQFGDFRQDDEGWVALTRNVLDDAPLMTPVVARMT